MRRDRRSRALAATLKQSVNPGEQGNEQHDQPGTDRAAMDGKLYLNGWITPEGGTAPSWNRLPAWSWRKSVLPRAWMSTAP